MKIQYFKSAWGDIRHSPGWFGKLCLLALLGFIPVFGQIVILAYLFGWAREIAWAKHQPMPARIIANDDGKFWRRGWFAFVLAVVFMLVPEIVAGLGKYLQGLGYSYLFFSAPKVTNPLLVNAGGVLAFIGRITAFAVVMFVWIGSMRVSIYDRLSAGFQLGKAWKMLRHDPKGALRVFAMALLVGIVLSLALAVITLILALFVMNVGIAVLGGAGSYVNLDMLRFMSRGQAWLFIGQICSAAGAFLVIALAIWLFCLFLFTVFLQMLIYRAMGYWMMQFDILHWGGQDDPMPFEIRGEQ